MSQESIEMKILRLSEKLSMMCGEHRGFESPVLLESSRSPASTLHLAASHPALPQMQVES
jgi:hypothetical protein